MKYNINKELLLEGFMSSVKSRLGIKSKPAPFAQALLDNQRENQNRSPRPAAGRLGSALQDNHRANQKDI